MKKKTNLIVYICLHIIITKFAQHCTVEQQIPLSFLGPPMARLREAYGLPPKQYLNI